MIITDQETGEQELTQYLYNNDTILCGSADGTSIIESNNSTEFDLETGEMDLERRKIQKPKFSIPKELLLRQSKDNKSNHKGGLHNKKSKCCIIDATEDNFTLSKKEQVITLQEEIILGYNKTSYRMFLLIASMLVFTELAVVLLSVMEIALHVWAHKKNCQNLHPGQYYRSPLHIYTSQFCNVCRDQSDMEEVIRIQEKRLTKYSRLSLKNMARSIY